jgi:hypothetical protein
MLPDAMMKCPHTAFERSCREIVASCDCPKFVKISGINPNDGKPVDKFGCIDSFLHMLLIENAQMQRQTGAAVESFRNEMVALHEQASAGERPALAAVTRPGLRSVKEG